MDRSHDLLNIFCIQLQHAIKDTDLIVPKRLFATAMELQERLQFCFFIRVGAVNAEHIVKKFSDRPGDRGWKNSVMD